MKHQLKKMRFDADYFYDKAAQCADKENHVDAIDYYFRSLMLEPFNPWTMLEIANSYSSLGLHYHALTWYYKALAYEKKCDGAFMGIINYMVMFGNTKALAYYLEYCASNDVFSRISEDYDVEFDESEEPGPPRFRLLNKDKGGEYLTRAKHSLLRGDVSGSLESLDKIDVTSKAFTEGAYYASLINIDNANYDRALELSDKLIEKDPSDCKGYLIRINAYNNLGDLEKRDEAISTVMSLKPTNYVDAMGVAICFNDMKMFDKAELFYEHARTFAPYEKATLLPLAECYHNNGKADAARRLMVTLCKINPNDYLCEWIAKQLYDSNGVQIEPIIELPKAVKEQFANEIIEQIMSLGSVERIEREFDKSDELYEKVVKLFASTDYYTIERVAEVFAESDRLRPMLRQIPVRMDVPDKLKRKCIVLLLSTGKHRDFTMFDGEVIRFYKPRLPKCTSDENLIEAYWKSYAALITVCSGKENLLFSEYKRFCSDIAKANMDTADVNELAVILTARVCSKSVSLHNLAEFCELLFDAEVEKCNKIVDIIDKGKGADASAETGENND